MTTARSGNRIWRKSSFTNTSECVELAWPEDEAAVRDSKNTEPTLVFERARMAAFLAAAGKGGFAPR